MKTLRERLCDARTAKGLSQSDLAAEVKKRYPTADITQQSLSSLETGKSSSISAIAEISEVLGVHTDWLALGKGPRERASKGVVIYNPRLIAAMKLMEPMSDYQVDQAIKILDTLAQPPGSADRSDQKGNG